MSTCSLVCSSLDGEMARRLSHLVGQRGAIGNTFCKRPSLRFERIIRHDSVYDVPPLKRCRWRGSYEGSLNAPKLKLVDSESILKITERVVQHAAKTGNSVIVGRGSQHFLRDRQDTLRVFLYAPREDKMRRLLARGKSEKEAEQLVDTVDRDRGDFIQKYFRVEWPNRAIYHTMINTAIGDEVVVHMILDFMKALDPRVAV